MIDVNIAGQLLNFGRRLGEGQRAAEQLEGAVAIHHLLHTQRVAYLADEVGMGKTYVALGALALFRHFEPNFRALIISPRGNIQQKWMKELRNFAATNVRFPDLRVKSLDGRPGRPLAACDNLLHLIREATLDPDRDFFAKLTSFSLPVIGRDAVDPAAGRRLRAGLRAHLPWLADDVFDLRHKDAFKENVARAICCALPTFDLVIVDEAHNLKHGFGRHVSARNRVLGTAMGHPQASAQPKLFPGFGPRARRVLFLSATPVEESYAQLWNQLDVFALGDKYRGLLDADRDEDEKKQIASKFLIRRVTSLRVGAQQYTKNQYRREWRRGGVQEHDEPIRVSDPRQRLVVALVQKKVSELLGHERFSSSFQIGMLASFESFLETAKLKRDQLDAATFDDVDQTEDQLEKEGVDVADVNRLARSYRARFGAELPHPKMDALVDALSTSWVTGQKALVFVRRVASVKELRRKLEERYDQWLMERLRRELPEALSFRLDGLFAQYRREQHDADRTAGARGAGDADSADEGGDRGGFETFFAWFFRGEGPSGVVSGANIQQRFIQRGTVLATFFSENYVADLLDVAPGAVEARLAEALSSTRTALRAALQERSRKFLSRAKKPARADRFDAVQAAAVEWLKDVPGPWQDAARIVWHERFEGLSRIQHAAEAPEIGDLLELTTFFTQLRQRPDLRRSLWPRSEQADRGRAFRESELRAQLLATAARLGHGLIDLYVMMMSRLGSLELRTQELGDGDAAGLDAGPIEEYLDLLDGQRQTPLAERSWGAFDELAQLAENFELILDVNEPDVRDQPLAEAGRAFGRLLRQQQPIGGMSGKVNQTLVRQFRMPGYPLALISTDLLQEGEDLHTFCSAVHHYGISWTPSSMEQRIGRIDRVRSQSDRRLSRLGAEALADSAKLQVYFPHLEDTVEVLQVQRVLERMNVFLQLMHEGLTTSGVEQRTINASHEFAKDRRVVPQILQRLQSAFPVRSEHLEGTESALEIHPGHAVELRQRFAALRSAKLTGVSVNWEPQSSAGQLSGTAQLATRIQPFTLILKSFGDQAAIRCVSPVGCVGPGEDHEALAISARNASLKIGAILTSEERTYDLTVESDVLLTASHEFDADRVGMLIGRVTAQADELEQEHLPGVDAALADFRADLDREVADDR